ncbi:MAG: hypothetical protein K0R39_3548 [Symbiobacteriaceae bacterium]|jgi:hypothetical protein|nr:hypothetical protein [Symbiobacteriaceae bacterium]
MLAELTLPILTEHLHTTFRLTPAPGLVIDLELTGVEDKGSTPKHEQFSAIFRGPLDTFLPQGMYEMEHPALGATPLFLVPIAQQRDGFLYQAVFSRFR